MTFSIGFLFPTSEIILNNDYVSGLHHLFVKRQVRKLSNISSLMHQNVIQ